MDTIIDLGREVVIDRSKIRDPYFRLWLAAVGEPLAAGSPWVAVSKPRLPGRLCKGAPDGDASEEHAARTHPARFGSGPHVGAGCPGLTLNRVHEGGRLPGRRPVN
jgi:hypothetical protein